MCGLGSSKGSGDFSGGGAAFGLSESRGGLGKGARAAVLAPSQIIVCLTLANDPKPPYDPNSYVSYLESCPPLASRSCGL